MGPPSDGEDPAEKRKRKREHVSSAPSASQQTDKYKIYTKPNYKRLFIENSSGDFTVYVESTDQERLGNKNPIILTRLFSENVKDITGVHRINAHKIGVTFRKATSANYFLKMDDFLSKNKMRAFVPSYLTEKIGILRYVPKDMSNEEIYKNIVCDAEVISIKRFMKKTDNTLIPLTTVAVTFASTTLPQYAYIQLFRYPIHQYIPPVLQCFKCLKFNHSAKVCRGSQMCSSCAGQHSYKECDVEEIVCINCGGNHLAISRDCPIKKQKFEENKRKYSTQNYAAVVSSPPAPSDTKSYPPLNRVSNINNDVQLDVNKIANNEIILNAIVKSLIALGNKNDSKVPLTTKKIKEILISNLI